MLRKGKVTAVALLTSVVLLASPLMLVQGQTLTSPAAKVVWVAENAAQQIQNLIDLINADDDALTKIADADLNEDFDSAVALYELEGLISLDAAQESLMNSEYEEAVDSAVEALGVFREVYSSLHLIMEKAGFQRDDLIENQGLLEAITRELQRIDRLRDVLPDGTPEDIIDSLDAAEGLLNDARTLLLSGNIEAAKSSLLAAKESISEVYVYLKEQAVDLNVWRLFNFCEQARQRIRERFRYGQNEGVDFSGVLQSFGYQSESEFMEAFQNWVQRVQGEQNFGEALQYCQELSQMVQQMEEGLNQEINRHHARHGLGGSDSGSGFGGSGSGSGGSGYSGGS